MSETTKPKRGRPPKSPDNLYNCYVYVRMTEAQYEKVRRIARRQSFPTDGGMSAAIRWCVDRMWALTETKVTK